MELVAITQEQLDALWDFGDPVASEAAFRGAISSTDDPQLRAELGTQLARALGLQERFDEADRVLEGIDAPVPVIRARVALERGRLRTSGGHPEDAVHLFTTAAGIAEAAGLDFLRVDALHMLAIAQPALSQTHTDAALAALDAAAAQRDPDDRTQRWRVSLHNNRGWALFDAGELTAALLEFEQALRDAERYGTTEQQDWAREAIEECQEAIDATADGAD
jgi:tetratricopeptide (TPR) repeat protein